MGESECETRLYHVPWLFNVYMNAVMKEMKMGMGKMGVKFMEEGRKWRLYADDFFWRVGRRTKGNDGTFC